MSSSDEHIMFEDHFDGKIDKGWSWLRENSVRWRLANEGLEIQVEPGIADSVRNALVRPAPDRNTGTFAVEVTVTSHTAPTQQYEQAGITWIRPLFGMKWRSS